eukprot:4646447-Prymnesium_polylepis.1
MPLGFAPHATTTDAWLTTRSLPSNSQRRCLAALDVLLHHARSNPRDTIGARESWTGTALSALTAPSAASPQSLAMICATKVRTVGSSNTTVADSPTPVSDRKRDESSVAPS